MRTGYDRLFSVQIRKDIYYIILYYIILYYIILYYIILYYIILYYIILYYIIYVCVCVCKVVPVHNMKSYRESRSIDPLILNLTASRK